MSNEELIKTLEEYDKEVNKLFHENKKLKKIINEFEKYLIDVKQFVYLDKLKELEKNTK